MRASGATQSDAFAVGDLEARKSAALIGLIRWNRTTRWCLDRLQKAPTQRRGRRDLCRRRLRGGARGGASAVRIAQLPLAQNGDAARRCPCAPRGHWAVGAIPRIAPKVAKRAARFGEQPAQQRLDGREGDCRSVLAKGTGTNDRQSALMARTGRLP
jgi:hypothetical protein